MRYFAIVPKIWCGIAAMVFAVQAVAADDNSQTVLIGFAAPLSGNYAPAGKGMENAAQLAIDEANARRLKINNKTIVFKLLPQDDRGDPRTAALIADYLVKSGVVGVIGHWNTSASIAASSLYHAAGIPQIAPGSTGHAYTQAGYINSFRIIGHDDEGSIHAASYAMQTLGAKRIAVIDDDTVFGRDLANQFVKALQKNGRDIVAREVVSSKTSDFNAALNNIKNQQNVDLIFFGGLGAQTAVLARSMKRQGIAAKLLTGGGTVGPVFLQLVGDDGDNTFGLSPGKDTEKMRGWKSFEKNYKARFQGEIGFSAPFAYDATGVLIAAIKQANSLEPAKIVAALHTIKYPGLSTTISFDALGNLINPFYTMYRAEQKKWVPVQTFGKE
ncbi:branched-chain amino acid ABC transporter substrate-binding protein [Herbaspirillum rhizosphaerae]|uniref:branched-chain amino acid ABC transporter substrate-binding protein n=1 Tax=Herbaspirillum rhizosphaerae TaxID=346179 RepID=UPI000A4EC45E|nr:branched-chain amino acid ABC transporter substrate-binding protein [Herbaspirillum rhizosphaerae]